VNGDGRPGAGVAVRLFTYGTLQAPELMAALIGRPLIPRPAVVDGFIARAVAGESYPAMIRAEPGQRVTGQLYEKLRAEDWAVLDSFEGEPYERARVSVHVLDAAEGLDACCYLYPSAARNALASNGWSLEAFRETCLEQYLVIGRRVRERWLAAERQRMRTDG